MILITSRPVSFHGHCSVVPLQSRHRFRRSCEISDVDRCKPWPTIDRCKVRIQEKLLYSERCLVRRRPEPVAAAAEGQDDSLRRVLRYLLWTAEAVYILWLFLLPYAPGDPVWAISSETVKSLVGLSLNFFFILPLTNSVGIHFLEAPVLHPMAEGLFNFVVAWTLMFAPLLYTDSKRDRYKSSLDVLWSLMMFLTNSTFLPSLHRNFTSLLEITLIALTRYSRSSCNAPAFLIPYMAVRLNDADPDEKPSKRSRLGNFMTNSAATVGLTGAAVCLISAFWGLYGRSDDGFGGTTDRWQYLIGYLGSERLAYAFIWDICLYTIFQPWLIGENLQNVKNNKAKLVKYLRFVPVVGLVAYLLFLNVDEETQ